MGALRIHEKEIFPAIRQLFKGKFVNKDERFLLTFSGKNIILKGHVVSIETLKIANSSLSYGVLEE